MPKQINKVIDYYNSTNFEYQNFWSRKSMAIHFGYYNSSSTSHQQSLINMNRVISNIGNIRRKDTVLDAGCGYGGTAIWLVENVGCSVTGSNIVPYQIKRAKKLAKSSAASSKLNFIDADYCKTGLPDESFSVIIGLESIVHSDSKPAFLTEAFRLLKPGGKLLISEYMYNEKKQPTVRDKKELKLWLKAWAMSSLLSETEYNKLMRKVGYKNISSYNLSKNIEPSLLVCKKYAQRALHFVGLLQKLSAINSVSTNNTVANYNLHGLFKRGVWEYKVIVAFKP